MQLSLFNRMECLGVKMDFDKCSGWCSANGTFFWCDRLPNKNNWQAGLV